MVHHGYGSDKHLGRLSYYRDNLAGTSSVIVQFMCCSSGPFAFLSEFWHQFGSVVAFFFPGSVLKCILTVKKEKMSFGSAP